MQQNRTIQSDGHLHGVIVGCQREDGRWLIIRRSQTVAAPLKLCFPGGGMDNDESQADTAVREMREEVGADIQPLQCVWHFVSTEQPLTLWGWHAELKSAQIRANPTEVAEILWLTAAEIRSHPDRMPRTEDFLDSLLKSLANP